MSERRFRHDTKWIASIILAIRQADATNLWGSHKGRADGRIWFASEMESSLTSSYLKKRGRNSCRCGRNQLAAANPPRALPRRRSQVVAPFVLIVLWRTMKWLTYSDTAETAADSPP
jgi:hypothetical protein